MKKEVHAETRSRGVGACGLDDSSFKEILARGARRDIIALLTASSSATPRLRVKNPVPM